MHICTLDFSAAIENVCVFVFISPPAVMPRHAAPCLADLQS